MDYRGRGLGKVAEGEGEDGAISEEFAAKHGNEKDPGNSTA